MRISHEAIYQALYIQGRGVLKRELSACLRLGRGEDDLILGLGSSAIGTLVERTTRFTMLLHLRRVEGHRKTRVIKNGPVLADHGAQAVRNVIAGTIMELPASLRRSLTCDQGAEMAQHAQLQIDTGLDIYFCDTQSPWQRGSNENTDGLLRQYFPKGTDLSQHDADALDAVAHALNTRPRKTLGWRTPAEALDQLFKQHIIEGVATTGQSADRLSASMMSPDPTRRKIALL